MQMLMEAQMLPTDAPLWIKAIIGFFLGGAASLLGGWDVPLGMLAFANVCDVFFGIAAGIKTEGFKPRKLAMGTFLKLSYWIAVMLAVQVDVGLNHYGLTDKMLIHEATVLSFFTADAISAVANMALLGVPVPTTLIMGIARLRELAGEPAKPQES